MITRLFLFGFLLTALVHVGCQQRTSGGPGTGDFSCLENTEARSGVTASKPGKHFTIEFPPNWVVDPYFENGLTGSDTLGDVQDYNLIVVSEFELKDVTFEQQHSALRQWIDTNEKLKVINAGQTTVAGYPAEWILLEDREITAELGMHYRINYIFNPPGTRYFFVINNETYGANRWEDLCFLRTITNSFALKE